MSNMERPNDLFEAVVTPNAETVLARRYYIKDANGVPVETATDLFWRVARAVAAEEYKYGRSEERVGELARKFYGLMALGTFLPNSPTLMNAGKPGGQLAACFVLPVGDSMEEIFDAVKSAALIHKSGGGTGFSFSRLRPKDSRVGSTGGVAAGPVALMEIFDAATDKVKQGGTRRGANMGILRVDHPDILEFIDSKQEDGGRLQNFNISVAVTDEFMEAVEAGATYALIDPRDGSVRRMLDARGVFDKLVHNAWRTADPGIIFHDAINRGNPTPRLGEIESTNPCGEVPLLPHEACNLGSINVSKFHYKINGEPQFNWDALRKVVHLAVRFLDDVIDASCYPLPQIEENVKRNRKIGLGVMGLADLLFLRGQPYDSDEGLSVAAAVASFIRDESVAASEKLALSRGSFPAFKESVFAGGKPRRNATTTSIAPTGTLSIIANCSSGIEPLFALAYTRHVMDNDKLVEVNPIFRAALGSAGYRGQILADIMGEVVEKGSCQHMELTVTGDLRRVFVTAMDINPIWHLRMQAAFQQYVDNAVSKTVNLPASATQDDIRDIYLQAWKLGCKGVTVYRDGCKAKQVLQTGNTKTSGNTQAEVTPAKSVTVRPVVLEGTTHKVMTGLGTLYLTINEIDGRPFEVFATIGKSGRSVTAKAEAIGRLVSLALRAGVEVADVVAQLDGIGGESPIFREKGLIQSIPDAVAWVLKGRYLGASKAACVTSLDKPVCPECGEALVFEEGCNVCKSCGFSKCAG